MRGAYCSNFGGAADSVMAMRMDILFSLWRSVGLDETLGRRRTCM